VPTFRRAKVRSLISQRAGLSQLTVSVDGQNPVDAHSLDVQVGPLAVGDEVVVNTTAVERSLGTGGSHIVHWNLSGDYRGEPGAGHIMKARYLSNQLDTGTWDEADDVEDVPAAGLAVALRGLRVVLCQLHSHVGAVAVGARQGAPNARIGYVMTDGGALPSSLSDLLVQLRSHGVINSVATAGQAFGGNIEAVNVASAVVALRNDRCDVVIVGIGPGHVGTGTTLGFSGLDLAGHGHVLASLGATVGLAVRASSVDRRGRHQGIGHHTNTLVSLTSDEVAIPCPASMSHQLAELFSDGGIDSALGRVRPTEPIDLRGACESVGVDVASMGRRLLDDSLAAEFLGAAAAWLVEEQL
jgi:hypothetical protein